MRKDLSEIRKSVWLINTVTQQVLVRNWYQYSRLLYPVRSWAWKSKWKSIWNRIIPVTNTRSYRRWYVCFAATF